MPALTETLAVPPPPAPPAVQPLSRYRSLRGKSVTEPRKTVEQVLGSSSKSGAEPTTQQQVEGGGPGGNPLKTSGSRYRRRAKTISSGERQELPPPPPPPPLPALSQKELNIPTRRANELHKASTSAVGSGEWEFGLDSSHGSSQLPGSESLGGLQNRFPAVPVATATTVDTAVDSTAHEQERRRGEREQREREEQERLVQEAETRRRAKEEAEQKEAARWADEVARLEAETDRILAEQKRKDVERLRLQLTGANANNAAGVAGGHQGRPSPMLPLHMTFMSPRSPVLEKFSFLTRGRRSNVATLSPTSSACASVDFSRATGLEPHLPPRLFMDQGGGVRGSLPQTDAPLSARNGAERAVQVHCRGALLTVAVTLETSAVDALLACADGLGPSRPINIATSVVIEAYAHLGLERRLRRYERVRDVLDSWDRDTQNHLIVDPSSDAFGTHRDLDLSSVGGGSSLSSEIPPPPGFVLQLYHSQRPGKWHKRFITLLESGQMFASKKADAVVLAGVVVDPGSSSGGGTIKPKDATSLCHLSDFDIYTPTEAQAKKHIKPPKKYCYAIKSQQKATLFVDAAAENFVHFFATEDPDVALKFHALVHGWRSWYLVSRRGIGMTIGSAASSASTMTSHTAAGPHPPLSQTNSIISTSGTGATKNTSPTTTTGTGGSSSTTTTTTSPTETISSSSTISSPSSPAPPSIPPKTDAPQIVPVRHQPRKSVSHVKVTGSRHRLKVSVDEAPYTIGAFVPLLDLGRFDKPIDEFGKDWVPDPSRASAMPPPPLPSGGATAAAAAAAAGPASPAAAAPLVASATASPGMAVAKDQFAQGGLLGASYEQRKQRSAATLAGGSPTKRQQGEADGSGFTEGPSLLNGGGGVVAPATAQHQQQQRQQQQQQQQYASANATTSPPTSAASITSSGSGSGSTATSPSSPPKPEAKSWFPSATAHTARVRAQSVSEAQARVAAARPTTSAGEKVSSSAASVYAPSSASRYRHQHQQHYQGQGQGQGQGQHHHHHYQGQGHGQRGQRNYAYSSAASIRSGVHGCDRDREPRPPMPPMPAPLVNLTPKFVEAPQWASANSGRGVQAPAGVPLVDLAGTVSSSSLSSAAVQRHLEVPPRNLIRRPSPETTGAGSSGGNAFQRPSTSDSGAAASVRGLVARARSNTLGNGGGGIGGPPSGMPPAVPPIPRTMTRDVVNGAGGQSSRPEGVEMWARGVAAERERAAAGARGRSGTVRY